MVKKIKFALTMKDGAKVRTFDELREHFDLESTVGYFLDGKLEKWLDDRYYEQEVAQIQAISPDDPELQVKLCQILGVPVPEEKAIDVADIADMRRKQEILKQLTTDETLIAKADEIALTPDDVETLVRQGKSTIYLYGENFTLPLQAQSIKLVGIGKKPKIQFTASKYDVLAALADKRLVVENVELPDDCTFDVIFTVK